jgi:hypothetical protein
VGPIRLERYENARARCSVRRKSTGAVWCNDNYDYHPLGNAWNRSVSRYYVNNVRVTEQRVLFVRYACYYRNMVRCFFFFFWSKFLSSYRNRCAAGAQLQGTCCNRVIRERRKHEQWRRNNAIGKWKGDRAASGDYWCKTLRGQTLRVREITVTMVLLRDTIIFFFFFPSRRRITIIIIIYRSRQCLHTARIINVIILRVDVSSERSGVKRVDEIITLHVAYMIIIIIITVVVVVRVPIRCRSRRRRRRRLLVWWWWWWQRRIENGRVAPRDASRNA